MSMRMINAAGNFWRILITAWRAASGMPVIKSCFTMRKGWIARVIPAWSFKMR